MTVLDEYYLNIIVDGGKAEEISTVAPETESAVDQPPPVPAVTSKVIM